MQLKVKEIKIIVVRKILIYAFLNAIRTNMKHINHSLSAKKKKKSENMTKSESETVFIFQYK